MTYAGNPAYTVTILSEGDGTTNNPGFSLQAPMPESFAYDVSSDFQAPFTQGLTGHAMIDTVLRLASQRLIPQSATAQIWQGATDTELSLELELQAEQDAYLEVVHPIVQLMKLCTPGLGEGNSITAPGPKLDPEALKRLGAEVWDNLPSYAQGLASFLGIDLTSTSQSPTNSIVEGAPGQISVGTLSNPGTSVPGAPKNNGQKVDLTSADYVKTLIKEKISIQVGEYAFFDCVVITNVQKTYTSLFDAVTGLPHHARVSIRFKPLFMTVQQDLDKIFKNQSSLGLGGIMNQVGGTFTNSAGEITVGNMPTSEYPINIPVITNDGGTQTFPYTDPL